MADAFLSATVSTNFGEIYIPQTSDTFDIGTYYSCYARGVEKPMSVINLQGVYNRLPLYDGASLNTLAYGGTWEEVNTQAFLDAKDDFASNVYFLWGSIDTGGLFFFKDSDGLLRVGCVYGWTRTTDPNDPDQVYHYQYAISWSSSVGIPFSSANEVGIAFTGQTTSQSVDQGEGAQNWTTPDFSIYTAGLGSPATYCDVTLTKFPPQPEVPEIGKMAAYIDITNADNLIQCVSDKSYVETINFDGHAPKRVWNCSRVAKLMNFYQNTDIWEVQGSWSGGKDIDTGIDPYDPGGTSTSAGGPGEYPTQSDTTLPGDPNASGTDAIGTGFVSLYNPSKQQVKAFNDYLFSESITEEISKMLKKLIADPIDYVVFIALCRFQPNTSLVSEEITFCGISTNVFAPVIAQQYQTIDYGKIILNEPTCSFMDYSPYAKASIYIPYVGFRDLPIDEIMGGAVGLKYRVDLLTGAFIAQITVERPTRGQFPGDATPDGYNTLLAQYEGNCYEMLPLSSTDFRNLFSGMLGVIGGAASLAGGNIGGLGAMASGVLGMKTSVNRSGQASGSYGYGGMQDAFILISRPFQSIPSNFGGYEGYPSNMNMKVSACAGTAQHNYNDGYLETDENTVWGTGISYTYGNTTINATDEEIAEIQELFNKGVIVNV